MIYALFFCISLISSSYCMMPPPERPDHENCSASKSTREFNAALLQAVNQGDVNAIRQLIQQGASVDARNNYGLTALHIAANSCKSEVIHCLIELGANVNADIVSAEQQSPATPLHMVAGTQYPETLKCLIALLAGGANLNALDNNGRTPLHIAAINNRFWAVKFFLIAQANTTMTDVNGQMPVHAAAASGATEALTAFVQAGFDLDTPDTHGITPLNTPPHILANHEQYDHAHAYIQNVLSQRLVRRSKRTDTFVPGKTSPNS